MQRILNFALPLLLIMVLSCNKDKDEDAVVKTPEGMFTGTYCTFSFSPTAPPHFDTIFNFRLKVSFPYPDSIHVSGSSPDSSVWFSFPPLSFTMQTSDSAALKEYTAVETMCDIQMLHAYLSKDSVVWEKQRVCGPGGVNHLFYGRKD